MGGGHGSALLGRASPRPSPLAPRPSPRAPRPAPLAQPNPRLRRPPRPPQPSTTGTNPLARPAARSNLGSGNLGSGSLSFGGAPPAASPTPGAGSGGVAGTSSGGLHPTGSPLLPFAEVVSPAGWTSVLSDTDVRIMCRDAAEGRHLWSIQAELPAPPALAAAGFRQVRRAPRVGERLRPRTAPETPRGRMRAGDPLVGLQRPGRAGRHCAERGRWRAADGRRLRVLLRAGGFIERRRAAAD